LRIVANNLKDLSSSYHSEYMESEIDEKVDALILLLDNNKLDSKNVTMAQVRLNNAINKKTYPAAIDAFKAIGSKNNASRIELLDEFSELLISNKFDSRSVKKYILSELVIKITLVLFGIVMITLGFAMIIMPAPPYFEMFTIYYFSLDDGVTLMDLISLVIVLAGVYVLVRGLHKHTNSST
jgi:hypothetical protein